MVAAQRYHHIYIDNDTGASTGCTSVQKTAKFGAPNSNWVKMGVKKRTCGCKYDQS